jgi:CHASE2 domain-containing sensor protein
LPRKLANRVLSWLDVGLAAAGHAFLHYWTYVERSYRRPFSWIAFRLKFAFYPLLAIGAVGWLAWDWGHDRSLNAAENAIFDRVINWRLVEPRPSGRVVVVEIDECSIEHFRARGEGGWPWSRQRHADLLERLDRSGVRAVGYDVLFADPSQVDPAGDLMLEAMAAGGADRFLFGSTRLHPDYDAGSPFTAAQVPGAFAVHAQPKANPQVALLLPFGESMARSSAIVNVTRNEDGILRDVPLRETVGDWALPSLPLRLAATATGRAPATFGAAVRPNWRQHSRLPRISAADLLEDGAPVCRDEGEALPVLRGKVVLVGHTAAGINDAKPTPVDPVMPGVEVIAEATEALVADSGIRTPPAGLKYLLAIVLSLLAVFAFFRGEPANDIDSIFVATNVLLLGSAYLGLTFFGFFFDIFAAVGFVSLVFGLCRLYAGVQRGRAVGNGDFLEEYDPRVDRWLAVARLRFVVDPAFGPRAAARREREYRRRLRRFLYAGSDAVMFEGVVERKTWLHGALDDLMILVWHGGTEAVARTAASRDLERLARELADQDARLPDDGEVLLTFACADVGASITGTGHFPLREHFGRVLASADERPLARRETITMTTDAQAGGS